MALFIEFITSHLSIFFSIMTFITGMLIGVLHSHCKMLRIIDKAVQSGNDLTIKKMGEMEKAANNSPQTTNKIIDSLNNGKF